MKKSLFALSLLSASGLASAQSSVSVFGIIDVGMAHVSGSNDSRTGMTSSGRNFSRLGFRGREDLGGGLAASFHLEGQIQANGSSGPPAAFNFARRSTVSLSNQFGEVRLGRDFAPTWWNTNVFDPGGDGVGGSMLSAQLSGAPGAIHGGLFARNSNSISYFLPPDIGGLYGQVQHAFGDSTTSGAGNYNGLRLGYRTAKWNVSIATGQHATATDTGVGRLAATNIGGFYDFDVAKLSFIVAQEKASAAAITTKQLGWLLGVTVPIGVGELRASYSSYDRKRSADDYRKLMLGYGYNLSKRTELYGTYARVDNQGRTSHMVSSAGLNIQGLNGPGGTGKGLELGLRHAF